MTKLGVVLVVVGALLMAGPIFGFSTLSADRGVDVVAVEDPEGFLGIHDRSPEEDLEVKKNDPTLVYHLDDNIGIPEMGNIEVTDITFNSEDIGLEGEIVDIEGNSDFGVQVSCGSSSLHNTEGQLTIGLDVASEVEIELDRTTEEMVSVHCPGNNGGGGGSDPVQLQASDIDDGDPSQLITFNVSDLNKEEVTLYLEPSGGDADYSNLAVDDVSITEGGGSLISVDDAKGEIVFETHSPDAVVELELSNFEIDGTDGTVEYEDETGRTDSDTFDIYGAIVENGETENGDINTEDDVLVGDNAETNGEVDTGGSLTAGNDYTANDEIDADGDISLGDSGETHDDIESGGTVSTGDEFTANGDVDADGGVTFGTDSETNGEIEAGGAVTAGDRFTANDDIDADGDIELGESSEVNGDLTAGGDSTVGEDTTINGEVDVGGDLYIGDGVTFNDDVSVDGTAYVGCNVTFNGDEPNTQESDC